MTFELSFSDHIVANEYFAVLDYRVLPVRGARTLAAIGYDDNGRSIVTFARQHLANPLTYTFTEQPKRS